MLRFLNATLLLAASYASALSLQLEKDVALSAVTAVPSTITYKIYATPIAVLPVALQSFSAGNWSADYDFTHFQIVPQNNVRFRALFTNTGALDANSTYYYDVELDGVVKGAREVLDNQAWLLYKDETVVQTTAIGVGCACANPVPANAWTKIGDVGTFTKKSAGSLIELAFNGTIYSSTFAGTGVNFEYRVDDVPTSKGIMRNLVHNAGNYEYAGAGGVFPNLSAGAHTLSVWVYSFYGVAGQTCVAPGCFSSDQILVKEYPGK